MIVECILLNDYRGHRHVHGAHLNDCRGHRHVHVHVYGVHLDNRRVHPLRGSREEEDGAFLAGGFIQGGAISHACAHSRALCTGLDC